MKILSAPDKRRVRIYRTTCLHCDTHFEFDTEAPECTFAHRGPNDFTLSVGCPKCGIRLEWKLAAPPLEEVSITTVPPAEAPPPKQEASV